jgi:hypothetical protein
MAKTAQIESAQALVTRSYRPSTLTQLGVTKTQEALADASCAFFSHSAALPLVSRRAMLLLPSELKFGS